MTIEEFNASVQRDGADAGGLRAGPGQVTAGINAFEMDRRENVFVAILNSRPNMSPAEAANCAVGVLEILRGGK